MSLENHFLLIVSFVSEFKKNEMNKYGAPRNCPDPTKPSYSGQFCIVVCTLYNDNKLHVLFIIVKKWTQLLLYVIANARFRSFLFSM